MKHNMTSEMGKRTLVLLFMLSMMVTCMAGCGGKKAEDVPTEEPEAVDTVRQGQDNAEAERAAYINELRGKNVLEEAAETLKQDKDIAKTYDNVETEYFEEMKAWETEAQTEQPEAPMTYLFLAKLGDGADAAKLSSELLTVAVNLPGMDADGVELECASCGGYLIMAGANNGSDIVNKFSQVVSTQSLETVDDIYEGLQADLNSEA